MIDLDKLQAARKVAFKPLQSHVMDNIVFQFGVLWKDLEKHPPLFRVGRLPKQFYLPNEFARAISNDFSEIQTDSGKVYRDFWQIQLSDCI